MKQVLALSIWGEYILQKYIKVHTIIGFFVIAHTSTGASRNKMRIYLKRGLSQLMKQGGQKQMHFNLKCC